MIARILVAIDGSEASGRALDVAADMAAKYDASLVLLHVIRDMQLPEGLRKMSEVEKIAGSRQEVLQFVADKILGEASQRAMAKGAPRVTTVSADGDPAGLIIDTAKTRGADLVVIGTRGLGELKGLLLGSVSRKVTNLCEINCLIVR